MILNLLPISAYSVVLKFDMKIFVNVARLKLGQLFTQGARRGHPCTLVLKFKQVSGFIFGDASVCRKCYSETALIKLN